jgi:hypothetical protein
MERPLAVTTGVAQVLASARLANLRRPGIRC